MAIVWAWKRWLDHQAHARSDNQGEGRLMTRPPAHLTMLLSRHTRRRDLLALLGGTAALAPLTARAQSPKAVRKLGVLMIGAENEPDSKLRIAAFEEGLQDLGWHSRKNIRIEAATLWPRKISISTPSITSASAKRTARAVSGSRRRVRHRMSIWTRSA